MYLFPLRLSTAMPLNWRLCAIFDLLLVSASVVNTLSSDAPYKSGVLQSTESLSSLLSVGCSVCHVGGIGYHTTIADIASCKGPYLFVGALSHQDFTFHIGAYALATEVQLETNLNSPHLSNGVNWYFNPSASFGFSENTILNQISSHTSEVHPIAHLSWKIDKNDKNEYLRRVKKDVKDRVNHIFNCPDRTQLINRRLASDDVPSLMPTPLSSFPTSYPINNQMPTSYPSQESAALSSVPTRDIASKYDDDDLSLGVSTNLEDMDTSSSTHHSLPSGTFSCTAILNEIYFTSKQQAFLPVFLSIKFFIKAALVVVIAVTCMTGVLILGASFLLLHKMRAVQMKSKSDILEAGAIPIAHEVFTNNGPVVVVEANLATNIF